MQRILLGIMTLALLGEGGQKAQANLTVLDQFTPGLGQLVSAGFDSTTERVWVYGASDAEFHSYTRTGGFLSSLGRPGESANDVDIELAPEGLTLGSTALPAGTLLFINGETGVAEIYAVHGSTGAIMATLTTSFGVSHVVGGAYHPGRNTFFLVQDRVPGSADENRIAEIDPLTGNVLHTFQITSLFSVNFGDLDVSAATGNLFVVSSAESRIAEFTPTGTFVQYLALPAGVSSLSGIGFDDIRGEAWVSGTGGTVWRLGGFPGTASCGGRSATMIGTQGDDVLMGTTGNDVINALAGNDVIYGLDGNDIMCGGAGDDILLGGNGHDRLWGEAGNDVLHGEADNDQLVGGSGRDTLFGDAGNDRLAGGAGNDYLHGGDGDDLLNGDSGNDVCDGGADTIGDTAGISCEMAFNVSP